MTFKSQAHLPWWWNNLVALSIKCHMPQRNINSPKWEQDHKSKSGPETTETFPAFFWSFCTIHSPQTYAADHKNQETIGWLTGVFSLYINSFEKGWQYWVTTALQTYSLLRGKSMTLGKKPQWGLRVTNPVPVSPTSLTTTVGYTLMAANFNTKLIQFNFPLNLQRLEGITFHAVSKHVWWSTA